MVCSVSKPKPGFISLSKVTLKDGMKEEFEDWAANDPTGLAKTDRPAKGCIGVTYAYNDADGTVLLTHLWKDRASFDKFLKWRMDSGSMQAVVEKFAQGPPEFTHLTVNKSV